MSDQYLSILEKVGLFSDLKTNREALATIHKLMESKTYKVGETLTQQGEPGSEFFVLIEGQVSIYKKTAGGEPYKVAVLNGSFTPAFGEGGLMEGEVRSASIICDTPVTCYTLSRAHFNLLGEKHPDIAFPIIRKIAQNLMKTLSQTSHDLMLLHQALMEEIRSS